MKKINFWVIMLGGFLSAQTNTSFTLIKDINPGFASGAPSNFTIYNGKLYFSANCTATGANTGNELWESDGTEEGTKLAADINKDTNSSNPTNLFTFNNKIYFYGNTTLNGSTLSGVLFSYDDTNGAKVVSQNAKYSTNFTKFGNTLYFKAQNAANNSNRLYYLDKDEQAVIADDNTNTNSIINNGTKLITSSQLSTSQNPSSAQLFGFDGTTFSQIKEINKTSSAFIANFYYSQTLNKTFFAANSGNGLEPWMTDGTENGTNLLKDINTTSSTAASGSSNFTDYNGKVYFSASNGTNGTELWSTDGTEQGTQMVKDIIPGTNKSSFPSKLVVFNNKLYFFINNSLASSQNKTELWQSDGTEDGTKWLASVSSGSNLIVYNNKLYYVGKLDDADKIGIELYQVNLPDSSLSVSSSLSKKASVYPNPSKGEINTNNIKSGFFEVFDNSGKLLRSGKFLNHKIFVTAEVGNYILKIFSEDKKTIETTKILIQ